MKIEVWQHFAEVCIATDGFSRKPLSMLGWRTQLCRDRSGKSQSTEKAIFYRIRRSSSDLSGLRPVVLNICLTTTIRQDVLCWLFWEEAIETRGRTMLYRLLD